MHFTESYRDLIACLTTLKPKEDLSSAPRWRKPVRREYFRPFRCLLHPLSPTDEDSLLIFSGGAALDF